ncbi:fatty acid desaturase [Burkholderia pyrrocinia]|uniref:fatty acid desaturase n=1 Tax=Burkholderia pyrrocinia TaxID=60550 RepID=UPI00064C423D|nr:fatty acid desaturase [Burkholderia pyrrocinia]AKM02688.1 dihydrorhizobitoxine desaturase [Burkholderia pyrrocinia]
MSTVAFLVFFAIGLQLIDHFYYHRGFPDLALIPSDSSIREIRRYLARTGLKKFEKFFAVFPFIWSYLYIIAAILVSGITNSIFIKIILILFVTGRFRTLQEAGHFAVHGALCKNINFGLWLANLLYQFPAFMPEASVRRDTHVRRHHSSVNMPHDPDLLELEDKRFRPGISSVRFWTGVFYPITPVGIKDRLIECTSYIWYDRKNPVHLLSRITTVAVIVALFAHFGMYEEMLLYYIIPVLITYPLFYWIAHISLHRWYEDVSDEIDYDTRELTLGRPTEFPGIVGLIVRNNIFPLGDSYHLAHSLFPTVRWNHLPRVDKYLKATFPIYSQDITHGLFISARGGQSILAGLKKTMVRH